MDNPLYLRCIILWLCILSQELYAQRQTEVDSLFNLLSKLPADSNRVLVYHRLSYIFNFIQYKTEPARQYVDSAMDLSEKLNYAKGIIESHYNYGLVDMNEDNYADARTHFARYIQFYSSRGDSLNVARGLYCMATIHADLGEVDNSLALQLRILKIYDHSGDRNRSANTLNGIGNIYWRTKKYDQAIVSYNSANEIYKSLNKMSRYGMGLQNLANVYVSKKNYDTATQLYLEALKLIKQYGSDAETSYILANLGDLHEEVNDLDQALSYNLQALAIRRKLPQKRSLAATLIEVGHLYTLLNRHEDAYSNLNEGLILAQTIGAKALIQEGYMNLSDLFLSKKDFQEAYNFNKLSQQWKDSIYNEENADQINKLQAKYESEKKDKQIILLANEKQIQEKEAQRQSALKKAFLGGLILVMIIAGLSVYTFRQRLKNQRIVTAKNEEIKDISFRRQLTELEMKALRAQINPHFLFNCLNSINRMIVKGDHENASTYLKKFSKMVRLIVENVETNRVSLENELALIESYIQLEELRFKGKIGYEILIDETIERGNVFLPPMVLQPFVENAIWHGLMHKETSGHIKIAVKEYKDSLLCTIEDNGVGRGHSEALKDKSENKTKSVGIKITEERLRLLNKKRLDEMVKIVDLKDALNEAVGTRVEISIPLA